MDTAELAQWISLHRATHGSPALFGALLDHFGSVADVYAAKRSAIVAALAGRNEIADAIYAGADAATELAWLNDPLAHIITLIDDNYPPLLREIADPPPLLYVRGDPTFLSQPQLAIVGSRNPTPAGGDNARAFARTLGEAGLVVVSGMAAGIDACAHRAALEANLPTIAVLGTGINRVYPAAHHTLAHAIATHGALVSDLLFGAGPRKEHFPRRNRLIAGLALGVLVVEAAKRSGSLITARLAAESGREVFAIPGSIHSPLARGCHALIRAGAKLVESAADVLEELRPLHTTARTAHAGTHVPHRAELPDHLEKFLRHVGHDPVGFDVLVERTTLTAAEVSSMLTELELRSRVASLPGGRYQQRPET